MTSVLAPTIAGVPAAHCLLEREVVPPRSVEVLVDGRWWPAVQRGWRMYDDGSGWRAAVTYLAEDDLGPDAPGLATPDADVPADRVRETR